jgi:hypothetical protein
MRSNAPLVRGSRQSRYFGGSTVMPGFCAVPTLSVGTSALRLLSSAKNASIPADVKPFDMMFEKGQSRRMVGSSRFELSTPLQKTNKPVRPEESSDAPNQRGIVETNQENVQSLARSLDGGS